MKKRFGLILFELPFAWSVILRLLFAAVAVYGIVNVVEAIQTEEISRRGIEYTLEHNPRSYYIRVLKYFAFAFFGCWYVTIGIKVRDGN